MDTLGLGGSTLGNMLGGAVQYGAMGALTGAATAAVTGGDIGKGALYGAAGGAVMGGLGGLDSGGGIMQQATGAPVSGGDRMRMLQAGQSSPGATPIGAGMAQGGGDGFFDRIFSEGGWMERNAGLVGPIIQGVGGGLLEGMAREDEYEQQRRMQQARMHDLPSVWDPVKEKDGMMHPSNVY